MLIYDHKSQQILTIEEFCHFLLTYDWNDEVIAD